MSEQHADLLQFQLREECLKLGAALFYCSGTVPNTKSVTRSLMRLKRYEIADSIVGLYLFETR